MAGQSICYVVNPSDSVTDLKQAMKDKQGIEIDANTLVFYGKTLVEDGKTLQQHGVKDKSVIHQILKVIGGATKTCNVCFCEEPDDLEHFPKFAEACAHPTVTCADCITSTIRPHIMDKEQSTVRCDVKSCKVELEGTDIARHATGANIDMLRRWEDNAFRKFQIQHKEFRYCCKDGCGNGEIYDQGARYPKIRCTMCKTAGCFNHFGVGKSCQPWHEGKTCQQYDDWLGSQPPEVQEEHFMKTNTKTCPNCYSSIVKNCTAALPCFKSAECMYGNPCRDAHGCDHITCVCGAEWCWVCLEVWPLDKSGKSVAKHRPNCSYHGNTSKAIFHGSLGGGAAAPGA